MKATEICKLAPKFILKRSLCDMNLELKLKMNMMAQQSIEVLQVQKKLNGFKKDDCKDKTKII
jgi:hypothetical protein